MEHTAHPTTKTYYTVYGLLLALLVLTVVVAEVRLLSDVGFFVAVVIATIKALLIILFFMHVRYSKPLIWVVAGAGFFWLAILFSLTLGDYFTRGTTPFSEEQAVSNTAE